MVRKDDELGDIDDESLARVKLISDKKKQLEEAADKVRQGIKGCFERLADALRGREKQLLRQVEAIHRQQLSLVQSNSELLPADPSLSANFDNEQEFIERLLNFGKIELSNSIAVNDSEPYKVEEYQEAGEDYVSFDKSLKNESEEFDVSSVIRRKLDKSGVATKTISINLNCTSCDSCKFETDFSAAGSTIVTTVKKLEDNPISPDSTSGSSEKSSFKDSENDTDSISADVVSPVASEKAAASENFYFEDESNNPSSPVVALNQSSEDDASKSTDDCAIVEVQDKMKDGSAEHPIQIQQWLQQILAETETEPIIHEIGQFTKIPNTRLYREFPVET